MKLPALLTKSKGPKAPKKPKGKTPVKAKGKVAPRQTQPSIPLPADLKKKLIALRRRYKMVYSTVGFCMMLSAISVLFLAQAMADWWFDLPWAARAMFLAIDAVILAMIYKRHLHKPLRRKMSLSETALMVEKKWPRLGQTVITAVQLADGDSQATRGSAQLVDIVLQQARAKTTSLNFKDVVPTKNLRRWTMWASVLTIGTLIIAAAAFPASLSLVKRIFLFTNPLPTRTIVVAITKDMTVPISTDVEISAKAEGVIPTHGRVTISYDDGPPQEFPLTWVADNPGTFAYTVHNVQRAFKYRFYMNDGHGEEFSVTAKTPPAVTTVEFTEVFPAYTGLPPQVLPSTNLSLLAGSHLKVKATATDSLKSAAVMLQGVGQQVPMTVDSSKTNVEADVAIPAKGMTGFSIHLVDEIDLGSANETIYPVDLVPDKPPLVKWTSPEDESETITLRAKPIIGFDASDDYGLAQLAMCYQTTPPPVAGQDAGVTSEVQRIPIAVKPTKDGSHYEFVLDVASVTPPWKEGWTVSFWIEATDNNTATGPGVTKTDHKQFVIVTSAAKEAEILERIKKNAMDINTLSDTQQKVSKDVQETLPSK
jgi:hypothetical protein